MIKSMIVLSDTFLAIKQDSVSFHTLLLNIYMFNGFFARVFIIHQIWIDLNILFASDEFNIHKLATCGQ